MLVRCLRVQAEIALVLLSALSEINVQANNTQGGGIAEKCPKVIAMLERIFVWFETRIDPFARDEPITRPPDKLVPFFWHYLGPVWWAFALLTTATLVLAGLEVAVMAFVARIVDLMALFALTMEEPDWRCFVRLDA